MENINIICYGSCLPLAACHVASVECTHQYILVLCSESIMVYCTKKRGSICCWNKFNRTKPTLVAIRKCAADKPVQPVSHLSEQTVRTFTAERTINEVNTQTSGAYTATTNAFEFLNWLQRYMQASCLIS